MAKAKSSTSAKKSAAGRKGGKTTAARGKAGAAASRGGKSTGSKSSGGKSSARGGSGRSSSRTSSAGRSTSSRAGSKSATRRTSATATRRGSSSSSHSGGSHSSSSRSGSSRGGSRSKASSITSTDHEQIRQWAEERGGKPACVMGTGGGGDTGLLRIEFPGKPRANDANLNEITWDEFFEKFDEQNLALLYQETTSGGKKSNFNKLVSRETARG